MAPTTDLPIRAVSMYAARRGRRLMQMTDATATTDIDTAITLALVRR